MQKQVHDLKKGDVLVWGGSVAGATVTHIELPDGVTWRGETSAPAWSVIEAHHLQSFLD